MIQIEGFNIRIVARGDGYGVNDNVIHDRDDFLVEFYDATATRHGPRGHFVSRYFGITILGCRDGLLLDGSSGLTISHDGIRDVQRYLRGYMLEVA